MNNIYYITRKELKDRIDEIVDDVLKNDSEYYLMVDNEPKALFGPVTQKGGKKVFVSSEKNEKLEKFVK